ncbi:MAG TPA: ATP-dependent DNA helicase [Candidatus Eisenbacteria bacterium]|nr:ATP-dependent DNA helicase [Candidatus Eisenbacteria bacterium]
MVESILNPQQKKAVKHGTGPLLIVAGAGTGKTTVVTKRIEHLIVNKNVPSSQILALTFTEKAAFEMQERVDILLPYGYTDLWIHTFHSFCDRILRDEAHMIGLNTEYKLISKAESLLLLQNHLYDLKLKILRPRSNPVKFLDDLLTHFSRLKDEDITPVDYQVWVQKQDESEEKDMYKELSFAYTKYEQLKVDNSFMDFSDLISHTLHLFRTRKSILKKYQDTFMYILVDEFQDTNFAQNELALLLAGESKNLTVVADDDQSIYRFRGAAVSNVLQFKKKFPGATTISLTQNYRSTQAVLDSAYRLIQHNNPNRLEIIEHIDKKLKSAIPDNNHNIEVIHETSVIAEADAITKKIEELVLDGYTYKDIAILVRANNHALPIVASLARKKIPHQLLGPEYLFQQEEIKDLIAYILFLSDITDSVSLFRILSMDVFAISGMELHLLTTWARKNDKTLFETIQHTDDVSISEKAKESLANFSAMVIKHLEASKKQHGWNILYDFLVETKLLDTLNIKNVMSTEEEKRVLNTTKFFERIKYFESDRIDANIYTLAAWLRLLLQMGDNVKSTESSGQENAVNVATIHGVKGLEFRAVFLVNLVSQRFPSTERSDKLPIPEQLTKEHLSEDVDFHLQEERRLFYVGMTRAKERLFFTAALFYGEGKRPKKLSPFVTEALPDHTTHFPENTQQLVQDALFEYKNIREEKVKKTPLKITSITYSNIQMFDICPLHYKAKVIFNIPTRKTSYQNFGISLHKTLYEFYKKVIEKEKVSLTTLHDILDNQWITEGFENRNDEKEQHAYAKNILKDFYTTQFNPNSIPLKLEYPFSFKLKTGVVVSGTIDRIDKTENGIEIIDYKTGRKSSAKKMHEMQLAIYALASTRVKDALLHQDPENITLTLYFLEDNTKASMVFTKKDLEDLENTLIDKVTEIEKSNFACSKSPLCSACEYVMLCESTPTIH